MYEKEYQCEKCTLVLKGFEKNLAIAGGDDYRPASTLSVSPSGK